MASFSRKFFNIISKQDKSRIPGLLIRRAQPMDFEAVIDIESDIHGMDYLPHFYHTFLKNEKKHCHVVCLKEKVIGFSILNLVDDNRTLCGQGGRILKEYNDQGIMTSMLKYSTPNIVKDNPEINELVYSTNDISSVKKLLQWNKNITHTFQKHKVTAVFKKTELDYILSKFSHTPESQKLNDISTEIVNSEAALKTLNALQNPSDFIPEGRWYIPLEILRPVPSNYRALFQDYKPNLVISSQLQNMLGISFGTYFPCRQGFKYNLVFYHNRSKICVGSEIDDLLFMHVRRHMELLKDIATDTNIYFWVFLADDVDKVPTESLFFRQFELKPHTIPAAVNPTSVLVLKNV